MADYARTYSENEVQKLLLKSEGKPRPSKVYGNPGFSDNGHTLAKHSSGGIARSAPAIDETGLKARPQSGASAWGPGHVVRATTLMLNSPCARRGLNQLQSFGTWGKSMELTYRFDTPVAAKQVEMMPLPGDQRWRKGMVNTTAETGTLLIEPNGPEIFIVTCYPDTNEDRTELRPGQGEFTILYFTGDSQRPAKMSKRLPD